eukprot:scaffold681576_cov43-Prasinocladus_malaysianus.AAC.1
MSKSRLALAHLELLQALFAGDSKHRSRAGLDGRADIVVPVGLGALDAHKEVAWLDHAAVGGDAGDHDPLWGCAGGLAQLGQREELPEVVASVRGLGPALNPRVQ